MKLSYDPSVDAAYLSLTGDDEHFAQAFTYACNPKEVGGQIHLDFDAEGRLIGIEILQASRKLPASMIAKS